MIALDSPRPVPPRPAGPWSELWAARELLRNLVLRNLRVKYQRSMLGFVWTLLNPLLTVGVLIAVFRFVLRLQVPHYWAFLLSGYFVWNFAMQSLTAGTTVLPEHSHLSRSVAFPAEVLIFSITLSRLVEFLVEIVLVLILLLGFHHRGAPWSLAWLPVLLLIQVVLVTGLTLPVATLSVFFHDVRHALPIGLMVLFYASPVFYPASRVPERFRWLYLLNPFAGLLTMYQDVLYSGRPPALPLLALTAAVTFVLAGIGYAAFRRYRAVFAEIA
jgi:lipopolysaccharide transport system permease protein